jgi:hypothetical protein
MGLMTPHKRKLNLTIIHLLSAAEAQPGEREQELERGAPPEILVGRHQERGGRFPLSQRYLRLSVVQEGRSVEGQHGVRLSCWRLLQAR